MKPLLCAILFFATVHGASAALTITISPGGSGTVFNIAQTSPNPPLTLNSSTVGFIYGIWASADSFNQDGAVLGIDAPITPKLGTLTNLQDGQTADVVGLKFYLDIDINRYRPSLELSSIINLASSQTHQMVFTANVASEAAIHFSYFIPGTYVENTPLYGQVTTVVIPEPSCLAAVSLLPAVYRRRRK